MFNIVYFLPDKDTNAFKDINVFALFLIFLYTYNSNNLWNIVEKLALAYYL